MSACVATSRRWGLPCENLPNKGSDRCWRHQDDGQYPRAENIEWETPEDITPVPRRTRNQVFAEILRMHPRLWAVMGRYGSADSAKVTAKNAKAGRVKPLADPGFQITTRRTGETQWTVYARFLPEETA